MRRARARALANVALVKYFGKRDLALNLPAAGSLSLTLEPFSTTTEVTFDEALVNDEVILAGALADENFTARVTRFLDIVRQRAGSNCRARVITKNAFPTAAGLASSASGFAALSLAATKALELEFQSDELSALARRGSGSAARSVVGGIAVWNAGSRSDGADSFARSIASRDDRDLSIVIGVADPGRKAMSSTAAMEQTRQTSPFYASWIESCKADLQDAVDAVNKRDFSKLGEVTERSALCMHAAALAARPGIAFWNGTTVEVLHRTRQLRKDGVEAYFTCDAGPQPKILCLPESVELIANALRNEPGITEVICCELGEGARIV